MTEKTGMCFWEKVCISAGFRLIHDGQRNPGQFVLQPQDVKFYTRKYQLYLDGKPVNTFVTFIYDKREAVDIRISYKDGKGKGELMQDKEVTDAEVKHGANREISHESGH